jgi:ABC-type multidrug transport system ATPase subunit
MGLLVLDGVSKRFVQGRQGVRERIALHDISLELEAGELVAVLGPRRCGRTTLLQVAAGVEPPSEGSVRFDGVDLARAPVLGVHHGIGYCTPRFTDVLGESVVEQIAAPLLGGSATVLSAQARAHAMLRRVDATDCAELDPTELSPEETIRVAIARALVNEPRLLLVDEPVLGVRLTERDAILALMRSIAKSGIAVLMSVDSATELAGVDRVVSLHAGELRGDRASAGARVVRLHRKRADGSE